MRTCFFFSLAFQTSRSWSSFPNTICIAMPVFGREKVVKFEHLCYLSKPLEEHSCLS